MSAKLRKNGIIILEFSKKHSSKTYFISITLILHQKRIIIKIEIFQDEDHYPQRIV